MKVKVNVVRIGEYDVDVKNDATLHDLRRKVSKIVKESKHSRIFFHGVILCGDETLTSYNVTDGSKLEFVPCVVPSEKKEEKREKKLIPTNTPSKIVTFHSMEEEKNDEKEKIPTVETPSDKEKKEIQNELEKFREELRHRKEKELKEAKKETHPDNPVEDYIEKPKEETHPDNPVEDYIEEQKYETYRPVHLEDYVRPPIPPVTTRLVDPIDVPRDHVEEKELTEEQQNAMEIIMSLLPPHKFTEKYVKFMYTNCNFDAEATANVLLGQ